MAGQAQQPFECNGRIFRVLEQQGGTTFQEFFLDEGNNTLAIENLIFFDHLQINGIAYHPTQNLIYGVLLGDPYRLCRIDADYELEVIRDLPLPEDMLFVSGDISPDERYLVLLGYNPDVSTNLIALVNLTDGNFTTTVVPITTTSSDHTTVYCADIAFHPTTGQLYGFDHLSGRVITIDLNQNIIDNSTYPPTEVVRGNVPSIFFTALGKLYGVGAANGDYGSSRNFYHFDVGSGEVTILEELNYEGNQDACSCPFKVKLLNRVSTRRTAACTEVSFTFTLMNRTDRIQTDLRLSDTLPASMTIKEISPLPFAGEIVSGIGANILEINDIKMPIGVDSFRIIVEVAENAPDENVYNYAYLEGLIDDSIEGLKTITSDDPETAVPNDPTYFAIRPMSVYFAETERFLCPDSTIRLQPSLPDQVDFVWSTGETTTSILVNAPGLYTVTVSSPCEQSIGEVQVSNSLIQVDLGADLVIERGQRVELAPEIQSTAGVRSYFWAALSPEALNCNSCATLNIRPLATTDIFLQVMNQDGCRATDELNIRVKDFSVYAPTAFSPNGDQINDIFYLQSHQDYAIHNFRIFDRWGGLVFYSADGTTNSSRIGWNGNRQGQAVTMGVYVWMAEVVDLLGESHLISGEVTVVR